MPLLLLELNEINFEQVLAYGAKGRLPTLTALVERHGLSRTSSEREYQHLEPWIQWVTAHTGLTFPEHGIFRLGDIADRPLDQIWEVLEQQGLKVGAISPMNASNRCSDPAFFMPDPWTSTRITGEKLSRLYPPIAAAVNANAEAKLTAALMRDLAVGLLTYAHPASYLGYLSDVLGTVRGRSWRKAMLLDRLLADVFTRELRNTRPDFASLFLNAGAHIQHHYLFNSSEYHGDQRNPEWYVDADADPVFEVYALYDAIVGNIIKLFPSHRIMIATGLHQDPHGRVTLYWRLRDHADFLAKNGIPFARVEPRMSRDFVVSCHDASEASRAEQVLQSLRGPGDEQLFSVHNRGESLFVELIWSDDIPADFLYQRDGQAVPGLRDQVAFVAIKNGEHNGEGYFIDTGLSAPAAERFLLAEVAARAAEACGVRWPRAVARRLDRDLKSSVA